MLFSFLLLNIIQIIIEFGDANNGGKSNACSWPTSNAGSRIFHATGRQRGRRRCQSCLTLTCVSCAHYSGRARLPATSATTTSQHGITNSRGGSAGSLRTLPEGSLLIWPRPLRSDGDNNNESHRPPMVWCSSEQRARTPLATPSRRH